MKNPIPLAKPILGREERKAIIKVLKSGNLAQGNEVEQFEYEFSNYTNGRECVAVNSGTSALHLALLSLGIGAGDEVIVPSFTFAATANSVALTGAKPVFVDVNPKTFNIDPNLVEKAISKNTKAIQVVHLYGLPADMHQICQIAEKFGLKVIEDAAQAHLSSIDDAPVGTFGDAAAFSFYPTKNMTSGEGGMIVFKNSENARLARLFRNQGMAVRYQNEVVGFNLRMTDLHAAIGRTQLRKLPIWTEKRIRNAEYLSSHIDEASTPCAPRGFKHVFHQYTIKVDNRRNKLSEILSEQGIGNGIYYPTPVHKLPAFNSEINLPETEKASKSVLSLPVHPSLTKNDLRRISDSVNRILHDLK